MLVPSHLAVFLLLGQTTLKMAGATPVIVPGPSIDQAVEHTVDEQALDNLQKVVQDQAHWPFISFFAAPLSGRGDAEAVVSTEDKTGSHGVEATAGGHHYWKRGKFFNPDCGGPLGKSAKYWWKDKWCGFWGC